MTLPEILLYLNLVLSGLALLGHAKGYFSSGEKKLAEDVVALTTKLTEFVAALNREMEANEKKLIEHDRRIQALESEMKYLPDRESQHRLELQLATLNARFATLEEKLKPIAATGERLHELLMEQAKK
jgi:chromosome segregation ATPase